MRILEPTLTKTKSAFEGNSSSKYKATNVKLCLIFSQLGSQRASFLPALNFLTLLTLHKKQFLSHICCSSEGLFFNYLQNAKRCYK